MNGSADKLDVHHIFGGYANRQKSEKYGLVVPLHHSTCHELGKNAVHNNAEIMKKLRREAQLKAMEYYGWSIEEFIKIFGRNYLC